MKLYGCEYTKTVVKKNPVNFKITFTYSQLLHIPLLLKYQFGVILHR